MILTSPLSSFLRRIALGVLMTITVLTVAGRRAEAQLVVVIVNGDPITSFDIEQRTKLVQASTHKAPGRKEVLEELIDEKLKVQLLKRYQIEGIEKDVDNAFANMARRMRGTPKEFTEQLNKQGIQAETIKARIRAELVWGQIIRGRYQSSFLFSDKDIQARVEAKNAGAAETVGYNYSLRPILFVVPRGSPPEAVEARRKEAESLRSRFQSCEEGIVMARDIRYVAVRAPIHKTSAELAQALREILDKTEVGKLTAPETTQQGIEMYAVCEKKQANAEDAPAKKEARDELFKKTFEVQSKKLLKELRGQAMVEYR
jgi:peptidyl-prolyl cis-trans isomerase SurA